ncbi:MAG: membrane protein insertion efficiency factor YidD [Geminocystis sp.]|nr:membrane protein insertion efficiency factor YidD [Geminocystis sp.]HIK37572.1 membrane protein insertion efficiency factor YidD [Geminocystis sp. M7585_C2015_104]MCS7146625.1 membrane protein insertion efficiency factor YidD [Geminocystis sp.]MCX8077476.1 membrane protein insertion efficiency factor YidD [Geminocystis sp.]MDW8115451.1 membrane protein insertion efficiency factor YidD [Geminocystis sp.]
MVKKVLIGLIIFYRGFISPLLPPVCRFRPTCSEYALAAIERFGVFWGTVLAVRRILRCHPFSPGGYDPLPNTLQENIVLNFCLRKKQHNNLK